MWIYRYIAFHHTGDEWWVTQQYGMTDHAHFGKPGAHMTLPEARLHLTDEEARDFVRDFAARLGLTVCDSDDCAAMKRGEEIIDAAMEPGKGAA